MGLYSIRLAEALLEEGVVIEPGALIFDRLKGPCPFFRLGYSSIASGRIEEGGGADCGSGEADASGG